MLIPLLTNSPQPVPILGQFNPVHAPISFLKYPFLILSARHLHLSLPIGFFPSGLPTKKNLFFSPLPHSAICLAQLTLLGLIARIIPSYIISDTSFLDKEKHGIFLLRAVEAIVSHTYKYFSRPTHTEGKQHTILWLEATQNSDVRC